MVYFCFNGIFTALHSYVRSNLLKVTCFNELVIPMVLIWQFTFFSIRSRNCSEMHTFDYVTYCLEKKDHVFIFIFHLFSYQFLQSLATSLFRSKSTVKLVLLDEADAMTKDAQFALRRGLSLEMSVYFYLQILCSFLSLVLSYFIHFFFLHEVIEKHTKSTRFALICNHVNKIIPALQSRCTRFRFAPLDSSHIRERLEYVIKAEG